MSHAPTIAAIDLALRAGIAGLMLFAAALLWRDHARSVAARLAAACAVGVAAYALCALPGFVTPASVWKLPLVALATGNAVTFWLFSRALFDDEHAPRAWHAMLWSTLTMLGIVNCLWAPPDAPAARATGIAVTLATLGFSVAAVAQSLSTWRADLVEKRRRLRVFIVAGGAVYTLVTSGSRLLLPVDATVGTDAAALASLVDAIALGALVVTIAWHLLGVDGARSALFVREPTRELAMPGALPSPSIVAPAAVVPLERDEDSEPPDPRLLAALDRLMHVERIYREEGLTIGTLAARLEVPEYRARRLINQGLGHRNFNVFVNRHRLDDAKRALSDPAQAEVPVLTIALDAGFQSIGPFNRAFKADTGMTPTEFRRRDATAAQATPPSAPVTEAGTA